MGRIEDMRIEAAARELTLKQPVTTTDIEKYLALVDENTLTLDFSDWAEDERRRNTPRWQNAQREVRQRLGLPGE